MRLFFTLEEHFAYLNSILANNKVTGAFISSFGMYAGITHTGFDASVKYKNLTRDFLESLKGIKNVNIMVGIADYRSCRNKVPCQHCEEGYIKQMIRLMNHQDVFPDFKWKILTRSHAKCTLLFAGDKILGTSGGRNLNDSDSIDATFELTNELCLGLYQKLVPVWKSALPLCAETFNKVFADQEISTSTFDNMNALLEAGADTE